LPEDLEGVNVLITNRVDGRRRDLLALDQPYSKKAKTDAESKTIEKSLRA